MLLALQANLGIVTKSADDAQINRATHYLWLRDDPDYKAAVEEIENVAIDFAEGKLHGLIKNGDTIATIFFLKTKGKKRGYIEKQEIDQNVNLSMPDIEIMPYDSTAAETTG